MRLAAAGVARQPASSCEMRQGGLGSDDELVVQCGDGRVVALDRPEHGGLEPTTGR